MQHFSVRCTLNVLHFGVEHQTDTFAYEGLLKESLQRLHLRG